MFGMMEALLSFLRRQVGLRTDAADAAGSLHAKVKEARDTIINTELPKYQKPRSGYKGAGSTTSTTYVTLLSVSGRGRLARVIFRQTNASYITYLKVTIDGNLLGEVSTQSVTYVDYPSLGFTNAAIETKFAFDLCFNASLVIEAKVNGSNGYAAWAYEKE